MNPDFQNCSDGASAGEETSDVFQLGSTTWTTRDAKGLNVVVNITVFSNHGQRSGPIPLNGRGSEFPGPSLSKALVLRRPPDLSPLEFSWPFWAPSVSMLRPADSWLLFAVALRRRQCTECTFKGFETPGTTGGAKGINPYEIDADMILISCGSGGPNVRNNTVVVEASVFVHGSRRRSVHMSSPLSLHRRLIPSSLTISAAVFEPCFAGVHGGNSRRSSLKSPELTESVRTFT
ncbi:hypothetical protein PIB30_050405 [Stylosanthes scabra]|uniref:Uncharacterized protein n=1 Tax=Stylosanthes scabra TaxID=79078 RepID=A0ABU6VFZ8_9FABA|nr:hypothetical protein [Stylosanthes scabra]